MSKTIEDATWPLDPREPGQVVSIQPKFIEQLLLSDEDATLDFKREQYEFEGAGREAKSELLKDLLAFANAFRRADAYILVGVEEKRGVKSEVVGVGAHLDDAKLQQFVHSKTHPPVTFSYREATHDGRPIGMLHIPLQPRPVYAKADYGKVKKEVVYLRRGSSTSTARPEEIVEMGAPVTGQLEQPSAELHLVDRATGLRLDQPLRADQRTWYEVPAKEALPSYRPGHPVGGEVLLSFPDPMANVHYYRDVAAYLQGHACLRVALEIENTCGTVIHDAKLHFEVPDPQRRYEMLGPADIPDEPRERSTAFLTAIRNDVWCDVNVTREGEVWRVECDFGKIQPGSKVRLGDDLLIGARQPGDVEIRGKIYADNISTPIAVAFGVTFAVGSETLDAKRIMQIAGHDDTSD